MFYDYEEYLNEPSEIDRLIEETKDKLHDLIKDEAKGVLAAYVEAKENIKKLNVDILIKKNEISNLQRKIEKLEEEYDHTDKHKMPKKYIDSFVKDYTGNFAPGDKVFIIDRSYKRVTCDKCGGDKKIKAIIDGEKTEITCVKCKGYGSTSNTVKTIKETKIDSVHLKLCFGRDRVNIWNSDCIEVVGREYSVNPKDVFKSYEDAKKSLEEY